MKREILFRGKRVDNGEWVYGLLTIMWGQYHIIDLDDENTAYPVDSATVGQYTGLTDRNGVKIFERDIAKTKTTSCEFVGHIVYSSEYVRFICITKSGREFPMDSRFRYEVIGNIHDNPELLEENREDEDDFI